MEIIKMQQVVFQDRINYPNLTIQEYEITFISGDSGCGKTTLFKLLNGTARSSAGDIYYRGENIADIDKVELRRELLFVAQVPFLFSGTILENFKMFHSYHESECPDEVHMKELLSLCCYEGNLNTVCDRMSGGERQRVFQSIALSLHPRVLLLDEPTSSLQAELSKEVMKNIITYVNRHSMSLVVISHDASLATLYAQHHIVLEASL